MIYKNFFKIFHKTIDFIVQYDIIKSSDKSIKAYGGKEMYRVCIKQGRKWLIGRVEYETKQEAIDRAEYFSKNGKKTKVVSNKELGLK